MQSTNSQANFSGLSDVPISHLSVTFIERSTLATMVVASPTSTEITKAFLGLKERSSCLFPRPEEVLPALTRYPGQLRNLCS